MENNLANDYANFSVPAEVKLLIKMGASPYGNSLYRNKTLMFASDRKLNNEQIDYYMHQSTARAEGELWDNYKNRLKFTRQLAKNRAYIYSFEKPQSLS